MTGGAGDPFEITIGDDLALIWGDDDRIIQVVTNLVENASRHGFGLKRRVLVQNTTDPHGVSIEVHDNGPGIPEEMRQRVFSRFWRSGPGAGSGLGMYIARGIVEQHGGTHRHPRRRGWRRAGPGLVSDQRAGVPHRLVTSAARGPAPRRGPQPLSLSKGRRP